MPQNPVPLASPLVDSVRGLLVPTWAQWVSGLFNALFGWRRTYTALLTFDFPNIVAQSQSSSTVAVQGVKVGDAVIVRPSAAVNGLAVDGHVSSDNVVTVRVFNFSAGAIDPASQDYRVIVFAQ